MMRRKKEKEVSSSADSSGAEVLQRKRSRSNSFPFLPIAAATSSLSSLLHIAFSRPEEREQEERAEEKAERVKAKSSSSERSCRGIVQSLVDVLPSFSKKTPISGRFVFAT